MRRSTTIRGLVALSLTGLTVALVACAEAPPADLDGLTQDRSATEPDEEKITIPSPVTEAPDAGQESEDNDAEPPPPPPPTQFVPETCDPDDPSYAQKALTAQLLGTLTPCPCMEGECCYEQELFGGVFQRVGCVEK